MLGRVGDLDVRVLEKTPLVQQALKAICSVGFKVLLVLKLVAGATSCKQFVLQGIAALLIAARTVFDPPLESL